MRYVSEGSTTTCANDWIGGNRGAVRHPPSILYLSYPNTAGCRRGCGRRVVSTVPARATKEWPPTQASENAASRERGRRAKLVLLQIKLERVALVFAGFDCDLEAGGSGILVLLGNHFFGFEGLGLPCG